MADIKIHDVQTCSKVSGKKICSQDESVTFLS